MTIINNGYVSNNEFLRKSGHNRKGTKMSTRREQNIIYLTFAICIIFVIQPAPTRLAFGEGCRTISRYYFDIYGLSASYPVQFEGHGSKVAFTYKGFGLGTSAFKVYAKDIFGENSDSLRNLIGFIAPAYLYCTPLGSHRETGEVTPFVLYSYIGWCAWGLKQAKLIDLGFGLHYHIIELGVGYNSIKAENRYFFKGSDDPENYPGKWSGFYISVNLSSGPWFALKSKPLVPAKKSETE